MKLEAAEKIIKDNNLNDEYEKRKQKLLSRDDIIMSLTRWSISYNDAFNTVDQKEVDRLHEEHFKKLLKEKKDFVIDRTNLTHKGRMKFINRLRQNGFEVKLIVLLPVIEEIIFRNDSREGKIIPDNVLNNMMKNFNMPFANEGEVKYIFE